MVGREPGRAGAERPRDPPLRKRGQCRSPCHIPKSDAAKAFAALDGTLPRPRSVDRESQRTPPPASEGRHDGSPGTTLSQQAAGDEPVAADPFAESRTAFTWRSSASSARSSTPATLDEAALRRPRHGRHRHAPLRRSRACRTPTATAIAREIADDILGHGPLERLLADDTSPRSWSTGHTTSGWSAPGRLYQTTVRFNDDSHLRRIINKIVAQIGRRIDESSPMVDARLPDGSRVNAVIPPLSL